MFLFEQSVLMAKQLEKQGVRHQFIQVPGGGHGFDRAGSGLKDPATGEIFDEVLRFLEKNLK